MTLCGGNVGVTGGVAVEVGVTCGVDDGVFESEGEGSCSGEWWL